MSDFSWRPVPRIEFHRLREARLQAHYAAQWLARAARAYLPEKPDDSHATLGWDDTFGGLTTPPLAFGTRLGLRVADLTLVLLGGGERELPLDGRAEPEVRAWLGEKVVAMGLDAGKLDRQVPGAVPPHVLALGARYSLEELQEAFRVLATWFANGHDLLDGVRENLLARKLKALPVRCWPRPFNLDFTVPFGDAHGMGIGFSPGDEYCDEPHFYVTIYPEPAIPGLPLLPALGHWHTYRFLAAFAPAHKIVAATDPVAYSDNFFQVAIGAALKSA